MCHLDEAGFALTLPPCYSWSPVGEHLRIAYRAPQGRRLNVIGGYFSDGPEAGTFRYAIYASLPKSRYKTQHKSAEAVAQAAGFALSEVGSIHTERFVAFVWRLAGPPPRLYVRLKAVASPVDRVG